jgi:phosphate transport system protein
MERHVDKEMEAIREMVIKMGTLAEESVAHATEAFLKRDIAQAQMVIQRDGEINAFEINMDKSIFEFFALKQPVAGDLRFLFSVQKMNKDLERIGDHAVNISQSVINYTALGQPIATPQIGVMISITRQMLGDSLSAFIRSDSQLALKVLEQDDQVDDLNYGVTRTMIDNVKKDSTSIEAALELIRISKNLERIADLSTNVAEDVIFSAKARDVKHHAGDIKDLAESV